MIEEQKYLFSLQNRGIKMGLERTQKLLEICISNKNRPKVIQILGTNGKGSTSAILNKILTNSECSVGLFTSPHLNSFRERIRVNCTPIEQKSVKDFIHQYKDAIEKIEASFFEVMTAMAFWYFQKNNVDYAIMETGLGGKYDSVTACNADIFGITSISKDHQNILGNNLEDIANEKVAAISSLSNVFYVNQNKTVNTIISDYCKQKKCIYRKIKTNLSLELSIHGDHQKENASLALSIANHINPNLKNVEKTLKSIKWYGRNQIIKKQPFIIFDVAHNADGIRSFLRFINQINKNFKKKYLLISIQKTKNIKEISKDLNKNFDEIVYTITDIHKSMDFTSIKKEIPKSTLIENSLHALDKVTSIASRDDLIAIIGTHFWGEAVSNKFNISFDNL